MSRPESHTALLVVAEALLRAADYPACRGLPAATVPTTLLGQLAGACQSVVNAGADAPHGHQNARSAARDACEACGTIAWAGAGDREYCAYCALVADAVRFREQLAELRGDRPGLCSNAECFRVADLPSGTCHHHSPMAQKPHPWQMMRLREGVFAVVPEEQDG